MARRTSAAPLALLLALVAAPAQAADPVQLNVQHARFDPTGTGLAVTPGPATLGFLEVVGGMTLHVADRPFVLYDTNTGEPWREIIQSMMTIDAYAAVGFGFLDIAAQIPISPVVVWGSDPTDGAFPVLTRDQGGVGDLVVTPRLRIIDPLKHHFGLAVQVPISLPVGMDDRYLGDAGAGLSVDVLLGLELQRLRVAAAVSPLTLRPRAEYGGFVRQVGMAWKTGAGVLTFPGVQLQAEAWGTVAYQGTVGQATAEWAVSAALAPTEFLELSFGAGSGIAGFGTPRVRAFAGVRVLSPARRAPWVAEEPVRAEPAGEAASEEPAAAPAPEDPAAEPASDEPAPAPAPEQPAPAPAPEQAAPAHEQSAPAPEQSAPAPERSAPAPAPEQPAPAPAPDEPAAEPAPAPASDEPASAPASTEPAAEPAADGPAPEEPVPDGQDATPTEDQNP